MPIENRICSDCVSDDYLRKAIQSSSELSQECDYCGELKPTIDMWDLAKRCDDVIDAFFEVSSLTHAVVVYDKTPAGMPIAELLERLLGGPERMREDVAELLGDIWFDRDSGEWRYGDDDPWFVEATTFPESLSDAWRAMERQLRHEARLVNPAVAAMLEEVFGPVLHYQTREGKVVIVEVGPGSELNTLFRAREFQTLDELGDALTHPERHLGPPPEGKGPAGRMNCAGVPVIH